MNIIKIPCARANYGAKRSHDDVKYIVIHYTAGNHDTAENEGKYFSREHKPHSSAHFFIGQDGTVVKSVQLNYIAWSVGGKKYADCAKTGGGKRYGIVTNKNSVSIELCDNLVKDPSEAQIKACKEVVEYIMKHCKNVVGAWQVVRHFDVNGKHCPARMMDDHKWNEFKARIIKT